MYVLTTSYAINLIGPQRKNICKLVYFNDKCNKVAFVIIPPNSAARVCIGRLAYIATFAILQPSSKSIICAVLQLNVPS
jgi:hypothetical protein